MRTEKIDKDVYLIDLQTAGIRNFIASYVLKGEYTIIVETGPTSSVPNLLSGLKELSVDVENVNYVAVSHVHLDHAGGAGTLLKHLPNAKVIVHQRGAPHLANPGKLWLQSREVLGGITELYGAPEPVPQDRIVAAVDGMTFGVGDGVALRVVETLGHASHHLSYYEHSSETIFPGDAAGIYLREIGVIVPTTPPPFRLDIALASLERLKQLKPRVLCYSHFGKADAAAEKLQLYENQLKLWATIAKQGVDSKESLEEICLRIVESDNAIQKAREYIKSHPVFSETVLGESVQGFVDFAQKYGKVPT